MRSVSKQFTSKHLGTIRVIKRTTSKKMRLIIRDNMPVVSIPWFVPYAHGIRFAEQNQEWIDSNTSKTNYFENGVQIGRFHLIEVTNTNSQTSIRTTNDRIFVKLNQHDIIDEPSVQQKILKAAHKALKKETELIVSKRVKTWSQLLGVEVKSCKVKLLRSRWGSCSSKAELTFSLYLAQIPFELIDYVIVHELTHITHMNHSKDFWEYVEKVLPDYKIRRSQLKNYKLEVKPKHS